MTVVKYFAYLVPSIVQQPLSNSTGDSAVGDNTIILYLQYESKTSIFCGQIPATGQFVGVVY